MSRMYSASTIDRSSHDLTSIEMAERYLAREGVLGDIPKMVALNVHNACIVLTRDIWRTKDGAARDKIIGDILPHVGAIAKKNGVQATQLLTTCFITCADPDLKKENRRIGVAIIPDLVMQRPFNAYKQLDTIFDAETSNAAILTADFAKTARSGHNHMTWFIPQRDDKTGKTGILLVHQWNTGITDYRKDQSFGDFKRRVKSNWNDISEHDRAYFKDVKRHFSDIKAALLGRKDVKLARMAIWLKTGADYRALEI